MKMHEGYVLREIAGEGVLLPVGKNSKRGTAYGLNETALFIVRQIMEGKNEKGIMCLLAESYLISQEKAKTAVDTVISFLEENNLINKDVI